MRIITYTSADEVLIVMPGEGTHNEQVMARSLFAMAPEDLPASNGEFVCIPFTGDRDPDDYDREVTETREDPFLTISLSTNVRFR